MTNIYGIKVVPRDNRSAAYWRADSNGAAWIFHTAADAFVARAEYIRRNPAAGGPDSYAMLSVMPYPVRGSARRALVAGERTS